MKSLKRIILIGISKRFMMGKLRPHHGLLILMGDLVSDMDLGNTSFYPVYALTMSFTSAYLLPSSNILEQLAQKVDMGHNQNVIMKPSLIVIPHGFCYATLADHQRRQTQLPITIKKFMNCNNVLMNHSQFSFPSAVINHVELLNGDEIAVLFTSYQAVMQERIWRDDGVLAGSVRKNLNYNSIASEALSEGMTLVKDLV